MFRIFTIGLTVALLGILVIAITTTDKSKFDFQPGSSSTQLTSENLREDNGSKSVRISKLLTMLNALSQIADEYSKQSHDSGQIPAHIRAKIEVQIKEINSIDQLTALAITCNTIIGKADAVNSTYDGVFFEAYSIATIKISKTPDTQAKSALMMIKARTQADAGEALFLDELIKSNDKNSRIK